MMIAGTWEPLQRIAELDATVEAQARELEKLRALLRAFLVKWDQVEPAIINAFLLQQIHGMPYSGPTIAAEWEQMRAARGEKEGL